MNEKYFRKKIWMRLNPLKRRNIRDLFHNIYVYEDIGQITIEDNLLTYIGKKSFIEISNITKISIKKVGDDFVTNWINIDYMDNNEIKSIYLSDGRLRGWKGFLNKNNDLYNELLNNIIMINSNN